MGDEKGAGNQLAEASKEAAGEEGDKFKQSKAVKWLAGALHIPVEAGYWVFYGIDFGIIVLAVIWFAKSKAPTYFRTRNESIRRSMDEARRNTEEARARLAEIEQRLARIDAEVADMRSSAEADAKQEEQRIRAAAEEDKQRIIQTAEHEIAAASKLAQRELKAYAASLAVELAERKIKIDPNTDRALVRNFAGQFGKDGQ